MSAIKRLINSSLRSFGFELVRTPGGIASHFIHDAAVYRVAALDVRADMIVLDPDDSVQRNFVAGTFYEVEEISIMKKYLKGDLFVDIGANVGNHAVYFASSTEVRRVFCFEPNPIACAALAFNIARNGLLHKASLFNVGVSDSDKILHLKTPKGNLGGAHVVAVEDGTTTRVQLCRGDDLLEQVEPGFLKIDVERHEVECLRGLMKTIQRCRPNVFIESVDDTRGLVHKFFEDLDYRVAETFVRYPGYANDVFVSN
jgi:FkbM family methyltransferase